MSQLKIDWPFGKSWYRSSTPRKIRRTCPAPPLAAQIEFLEDRKLLSVTLGGAASFAVLAGSAVTNAGPSAISGNVGVSPGGAVSGFAAGQVTNGSIHVNDAVAVQAHSDAATAYNALAGEAVTTVLTGQDLGGLTLAPGVYFFSSSAQLTGKLTLDAQGDPHAEFVFQIGSTLTTASNSSVVMIGSAQPSNVYWQVGSSATLGTGTALEGNILALTSITVTSGASILNGSALAINGAVTLDDNAITDPNAPPTLSGFGGIETFVKGSPPITVVPNLVVTAPQGEDLVSATVSFTNWQGEDRLAFFNTLGLQHQFVQDFVAHTATLTIQGLASAAGYQTLLRSVTYQDVAGNPNTAPIRVATFTVNSAASSASGTQSIRVVTVLGGLGETLTYIQGTPAMPVAPNLVISLPAGQNITSSTVSFTNWQGEDRLAFYNSAALQHTFTQDLVAHTATLTITGTASASVYQTLLRSVTYQDVAGIPNTSTVRHATITVNAGIYTSSGDQTIRAATVVGGLGQTTTYVRATPATSVAPNLVVTLPQGVNATSATVTLTNWLDEDRLALVNSAGLQHTFTQDPIAHTATLTITGSATAATYQTVLRSVTYQDVAGSPNTAVNRQAKFTVNSAAVNGSATQTIRVTTSA